MYQNWLPYIPASAGQRRDCDGDADINDDTMCTSSFSCFLIFSLLSPIAGSEEQLQQGGRPGKWGHTTCLFFIFCLPHAGYGRGTTTRTMDDDARGPENIAAVVNNSEEVRWLYYVYLSVCLSFCLPHAGYGERQQRGARMAATMTGREENIAAAMTTMKRYVGHTTCLFVDFLSTVRRYVVEIKGS